jgi:hypothetical protein
VDGFKNKHRSFLKEESRNFSKIQEARKQF